VSSVRSRGAFLLNLPVQVWSVCSVGIWQLPDAKEQFNDTRKAAMKKLESKRITKIDIFWSYLHFKKLGIDYNIDAVIYEKLKSMTYEDFTEFFNEHIANKKYSIGVIGKKESIDFDMLEEYGEIKEVSLEEIFNY